MSGLIGGAVRRQLEGKVKLRALNRRDVAGVDTVQADIADYNAIRRAFDGVDTVVHLAAVVAMDASMAQYAAVSLTGTYNVFEAAKDAGVRRVVYASSGATVSGWETEEPYKALIEGRYADVPTTWPKITYEWPVNPKGLYGASKVWGEALARHYTTTSDLSIICLRIGMVREEDRPLTPRDYSVWCSQRDISTMVDLCVTAKPDLRYDILFVESDNKWSYRDVERSQRVIGFTPQDAAENYRDL
jgi:nucleoside-diphosphate-sugar epimerase